MRRRIGEILVGGKAVSTELRDRALDQQVVEADLAEPHSADFAEQATEREDDDALEGQDALLGREITAIKAALGRIEDGSYGECTRCGEPVGEKRLEAYPEAALCISCARELEQR